MQAASLASLRIVPAATGQSEGGACKFRSRSKDHRRQAVRLLTFASHRLDDGGYDRPAAGKRAISPGASRGEQAKQPLATQLRRFRCRVSKEAPSCVKRQLVSDVQPIADEQGEKRADEGQGDASEPPGAPKSNPEPGGKSHVWALALLCLSYLHHSTAGFALPSFLPNISRDLHLLDTQSSYLSVGYTALYALALIPAGLLADKTNRINFLAVAVVLWSGLTMATSKANGFEDLLLIRVGFAVAQAAQNPVCFSLIPELFPKNRSIAMAFYNSAIYLGRALSFAALFALASTQASDVSGVTLVPVNDFDPTQWSLLYTFGDQAAVTPVFNYNFIIDYAPIANPEQWRSALFYIGPPGLFIAWLILITLEEPRYPSKAGLLASSRFFWSSSTVLPKTARGLDTDEAEITAMSLSGQDGARDRVAPTVDSSETTSTGTQILDLLKNRSFLSVTAAATMNDLASWSLVAWQAAFYERVHGIGPEVYAPLLACAIPVGGIFGGVGGALVADKLGSGRGRAWLTSAANLAAAPLLAASLLVEDYHASFMYLTLGFALSEAWRAPSAVLVRDIAADSLGATASAIHLCFRNLLGGLGPLAVALLTARQDSLQQAMLFIPMCYGVSGGLFFLTEIVVSANKDAPVNEGTVEQK